MWGCDGPGGTTRAASRPARAKLTAQEHGLRGPLAALPYAGDQPRGHDGDALSPAALPGGGQQRAGQQVTSKDGPACASRAAPIPCTTPGGDQQPGSTARPPEMLAATNTTRPIRYSLARPQASARRPPSSKNPPKATA